MRKGLKYVYGKRKILQHDFFGIWLISNFNIQKSDIPHMYPIKLI